MNALREKPQTGLVKLALRRDNSYPVGVAAPMHCLCRCGNKISVEYGQGNQDSRTGFFLCPCGVSIDSRGWMQTGPFAQEAK